MELTVTTVRSMAERERLAEFRYRIYVEELGMTPPAADRRRRRLWDEQDEVSTSFVLVQEDGEILGSLRLTHLDDVQDPRPFERKFELAPALAHFGSTAVVMTSRFIVDKRVQHGRRIFELMESCFDAAVARGAKLNYGDCSPVLLPFYEHMGYRRYARTYNDPAYGFKYPILMLLADGEQFRRVRSPLLRAASKYPREPELGAWFESMYPDYVECPTASLLPPGRFRKRIGDLPLFTGMSEEEADQLLAKATLIHVWPGDCVLRAGARGNALFVVLAGQVALRNDVSGAVTILGRNGAFGELGRRRLPPFGRSVVALSDCDLLVLSSEYVERTAAKHPELMAIFALYRRN